MYGPSALEFLGHVALVASACTEAVVMSVLGKVRGSQQWCVWCVFVCMFVNTGQRSILTFL